MGLSKSKRYLAAAMIGTALAILVHSYLSYHYYLLKFGESSRSVCNLNATFDCDSVAASPYSSFLSIPLALWGAMTNLALLILLGGSYLLGEQGIALKRQAFLLAIWVALMSLIMGTISFTRMNTYCLFCMSAYILSFFTLAMAWLAQTELSSHLLKWDLRSLFGKSRGILILYACVPVGAWLVDGMALKNFQADVFPRLTQSSLGEWQANPVQKFDLNEHSYLTMGPPPEKAVMNIVEFADFRCSHCRDAAPKLHAFVHSHPDVRLTFQSFPLDGQCNPKIPNSSGISCRLAKAVYCAVPTGHGWQLHDAIFEKQEVFTNVESVDAELKGMCDQLKIDWAQLEKCMSSDETHQEIMAQAKRGDDAGVQGTPTIYVNGRYLPGGQLLPILDALYRQLKDR